MTRAFLSEWVKLRRRAMLLGGLAVIAFAVLVNVLAVERARANGAPGPEHGFRLTIAELSLPSGLAHGLTSAATLLGVIVLCIFAGAFAAEYSHGTLRNLLRFEPRRMRLLGGKYAALVAYMVGLVVLAAACGSAAAFALAPSRGIDTSGWSSATGIHDMATAVVDVLVSCLGYGTLGAVLGLLLRSPVAAVAVGVAYVLPGEAIITALWDSGSRWLPGQLLDAVANGGNGGVSFQRAGIVLLIYGLVACAASAAVFQRRDVAA